MGEGRRRQRSEGRYGTKETQMTRSTQKASERQTLDTLLSALGLRPEAKPVEGETPDFMLTLSGRRIGVEVTMYRSGDTVEGGSERRQAEAEWAKHFLPASDAFRSGRPELRDVNVGLMLKGPVPPRRLHADFMEEIAAFIRAHRNDLKTSNIDYWRQDFSTPLMGDFLQTVYLRIDPHAVWHSSLAAGFVATPATSTVADIVASKSGMQFHPADELWLAIQCGTLISETLLPIVGVADFDSVPPLDGFLFSRVFVLTYLGVFQWKRGDRWRKLTGRADAA
jgi:hypothetical protein